MTHMISKLAVTALLLLWPGALLAQKQEEAIAVVRKIDELYRSTTSAGEMEMEIVTPHWQRTLRLQIWTEGMDKTFIRILAPLKEKGVATLRLGNEMWNYLPNTNKVIKIPPSMMMSSWMGSDFTNDDLVSEFTLLKDFHFRLMTPDTARPGLLYLEAIPREGLPIVWGKIVTVVQKQDYLPVSEAYFDEKGNLMRVIHFKDAKLLGGRRIPATLELIPKNKQGHKTVIRYLTIDFDLKLDREVFSLRNLQAR
ncbi:MAG: hypothetical protein DKINENOH_01277 [bacterium]|nr:hypothetical protein [bacterium]